MRRAGRSAEAGLYAAVAGLASVSASARWRSALRDHQQIGRPYKLARAVKIFVTGARDSSPRYL